MDIQTAYNEWSGIYDTNTNLTRDLDSKLTRDLLAHQKFDSILELGCGTGKNTIFFSQIGKKVHALDFSPGMIEKARTKVSASHVRFEMADLTKHWPCQNEAYDLISCNLVLEHIAELPHIFSEAARVLHRGGKFLINELHPFKQYQGTKARFERGTETVELEVFVHHISEFITTALKQDFKLLHFNEYWHPQDDNKPPRIAAFIFEKQN
ncbi:MAG TPA: class I SAM-dependent methyltransferase [Anaerolineales bacterium]|nr:class I SAM-dependent methyltransferase [Anaerolineales bacterium]HNH79569.1 class I SAM-dependent methyltransferase [Anaerolineales bacterium]